MRHLACAGLHLLLCVLPVDWKIALPRGWAFDMCSADLHHTLSCVRALMARRWVHRLAQAWGCAATGIHNQHGGTVTQFSVTHSHSFFCVRADGTPLGALGGAGLEQRMGHMSLQQQQEVGCSSAH